jgi:hypothetical protein
MPTVTASSLGMTAQADFLAGGGTDYESVVQAALDAGNVIDLEGGTWNTGNGLGGPANAGLKNGKLYFSVVYGPHDPTLLPGSPPYDRPRIWNTNKTATGTPTDTGILLQDLWINCNGSGQQHSNPTNGFVTGLCFIGATVTLRRVRIYNASTFATLFLNADVTVEDSTVEFPSGSPLNTDGWHFEGPCTIDATGLRAINTGDDALGMAGRFPDPDAGETASNSAADDDLFRRFLQPSWMSGWHGGAISGTIDGFYAKDCRTPARFICPIATVAHPVDAKLSNFTLRNFTALGVVRQGFGMGRWDSGPFPFFENVTLDGIYLELSNSYSLDTGSLIPDQLGVISIVGKIAGSLVVKNVTRKGGIAAGIYGTILIRSTQAFTSLDVSGYALSMNAAQAADATANQILVQDTHGGMPAAIDARNGFLSRLGNTSIASTLLAVDGAVSGTVDVRNSFSNNSYYVLAMTPAATIGAVELSGVEFHGDTSQAAFLLANSPTVNSGNVSLMGTGGTTDKWSVSSTACDAPAASVSTPSTATFTNAAAGTNSPPSTAAFYVEAGPGTIGQRSGIYTPPSSGGAVAQIRAVSLADATKSDRAVIAVNGTAETRAEITSVSGGTARNDASIPVGNYFTVGDVDISVTALGRWKIAGNSATHAVNVYAGTETTLAGATPMAAANVDMTTGSAAGFVYAALAEPIVLEAGKSYYVLSDELDTADQWYNFDSTIAFSSDLAALRAAYVDGLGAFQLSTANKDFGPVGFQYGLVIEDIPTGPAPALAVSVNGGSVASGGTKALGTVERLSSQPVTLVISNTGDANGTLGTIAVGSKLAKGTDPSGRDIAAGALRTLTVTLDTSAAATINAGNATITIPSDDASSPYTVILTASVTDTVAPALASPRITPGAAQMRATLSESGCTADGGGASGTGGFTFTGSSVTIDSWAISGVTVTFTLSAVVVGAAPTLSYSRSGTTDDIKDSGGNYLANFSGLAVSLGDEDRRRKLVPARAAKGLFRSLRRLRRR